ncbi:MAG TPA: hypothetical protein VK781_00055 [Solirubrobacteraceae bacterium]|jgi:hypothetical protein|nr:hypothetical protein [Solirubrobacteraceae bacterium]
MALALTTAAIVLVALLWVLALPHLWHSLLPKLKLVPSRLLASSRVQLGASPAPLADLDPGRELRAEQRARALLRSCINEEEWAMYSELGFLRIWGALPERPAGARRDLIRLRRRARAPRAPRIEELVATPYAYLIYPNRPILAYVPHTGVVLGEYCIEFPDHTRPYGSSRLPDADDVLAKWVALTTEERALIEQANMHLPGRQIGLEDARRDILRLSCWERERLQSKGRTVPRAGSVPAR